MYGERASEELPGAVVWWKHVAAGEPRRPVAPDGCLDVIWTGSSLLVAGPDTGPNYYEPATPEPRYVGLRLPPGVGPRVLGVPADELRDGRAPLADVWPSRYARQLTEQVGEADAPGEVLEAVASARACRAVVDPVAGRVLASVRAGASVAATAAEVGLSERQLHRRCLPAFGYGPKTLARVLRMTRAVDLARRGTPFATVAAVAGYADQAHLSRDIRSLTGVSLGELVAG